MNDWTKKLFVDRSDLFLKLLDEKWAKTEELVNGIVRVLSNFGVTSGNMLDLCCGNGRISIYMAKKGFKTVGVDFSEAFLKDARRKAKENNVSDMVTFLEGDIRDLKKIIGRTSQPFDVVVNAWTSIGYTSQEDDLTMFKQARQLSKENAILFITETMHTDYISLKFTPTSYQEIGDIVLLENRKYDPTTSQISSSWTFYNRNGEDLLFIDRIEIEHHIYSISELSSLLRKAGWKPEAFYGSLSTLQPMSPLTSMNIVAKA